MTFFRRTLFGLMSHSVGCIVGFDIKSVAFYQARDNPIRSGQPLKGKQRPESLFSLT